MKRKLLLIIFSFVCATLCTFGLAGCNFLGGNNTGNNGNNGGSGGDSPSTPSLCKHDFEILHTVEDHKDPSCTEEGYDLNVFVCPQTFNDPTGKRLFCGAILEKVGEDAGAVVGNLDIWSEYEYKRLVQSGEIKERLTDYRTTLQKTPHTPVTDPAVPATCIAKGLTEGSHCGVCSTVIKAQTETDYVGHVYTDVIEYYTAMRQTDKVCRDCGRLENAGYTFKTKINDDEQSYTLEKGDGWEELSFDGLTYNGKQVTVIGGIIWLPNEHGYHDEEGEGAFYSCASLTQVDLYGIKEILGNAFANCSNLKTVNLGSDLKKISSYAFNQCDLMEITIPDSVETIGWAVFYGNNNIESISVPFVGVGKWNENCCVNYGVSEYFDYIFAGNSNIPKSLKNVTVTGGEINSYTDPPYDWHNVEHIVIGEGVTYISYYAFKAFEGSLTVNMKNVNDYAFDCCKKLTNITIGNSVESIGNWAFNYCSSLTSISIPYGVKSIGKGAFQDCSSLESITIPNSVTNINAQMFLGCSSLTSISIPNSVTSIGNYAFYDCTNLTNITYRGTKEQWKVISSNTYWNSETGDFTVTCTDGKLDKNGNEIQ